MKRGTSIIESTIQESKMTGWFLTWHNFFFPHSWRKILACNPWLLHTLVNLSPLIRYCHLLFSLVPPPRTLHLPWLPPTQHRGCDSPQPSKSAPPTVVSDRVQSTWSPSYRGNSSLNSARHLRFPISGTVRGDVLTCHLSAHTWRILCIFYVLSICHLHWKFLGFCKTERLKVQSIICMLLIMCKNCVTSFHMPLLTVQRSQYFCTLFT